MPDQTFTRCPGCATVFRVTAAQLALREGQVRCGHCRAVFDANDHRVALDEHAMPDPAVGDPAVDDPAVGDPAVGDPAVGDPAVVSPAIDRAPRFEWKPRKPLRERPRALYGAAILLLLLALALQMVLEYRNALSAHAPFTRPLLQSACGLLGCSIDPLHDSAALSIDASDLQADPAHRGLLLLSATIRNRASYSIAYPYLELTLTDSADQVVVRRAFAPADYADNTADPTAGIPANGEKLVKLFIDASATSQAGYRLYLFYP